MIILQIAYIFFKVKLLFFAPDLDDFCLIYITISAIVFWIKLRFISLYSKIIFGKSIFH